MLAATTASSTCSASARYLHEVESNPGFLFCCRGAERLGHCRDGTLGVTIVGDYRRVLHSNLATRKGRRLIVTCYTSQSLVNLVAGAGGEGGASGAGAV